MTLLLLVGLGIAAGLLVVLLDALVRRPVAATRLLLFVVVLRVAIADNALVSVELAGFRVSPWDVIFSLVIGAGIIRFLRIERTAPQQKALIVLGLILLVSLLLGMAAGPIAPAINDFRHYLGFVGSALYFSTVVLNEETRDAMAREWTWAGVVLGGLVILRWASRFGGIGLGIFDTSNEPTLRVVSGPTTMTIAVIALILLLPGIHRHGWRGDREKTVGAALLLIAILLNRRTLWLALAVVLLVLVLRDRRVGRRLTGFVVAGVALLAIAVPVLSGGDASEEEVAVGITDTENLFWRVEGWRALLESGPDQLDEYLIGLPFGSGYERIVGEAELASTPHNFYLQTYLRTGAIGLAALLLAQLLTVPGLLSATGRDDGHPLSRDHLLLLLILLGVWMLTWSPSPDQGIILGLAIAAVSYQGLGRSRMIEPVRATPR